MAAIKAVDESMYSDGRGGITVLRGLWKVFDSVVSELGTELTATLANKAIFDANAMQENLQRQGRVITNLEKKSDALMRKKRYEADLKTTMLRLRGTFADVILGTKKELQNTIDKSFAAHTDDMEKSLAKRLKEAEKKMEQKFTKKAIDAERSFAQQLKDRDSALAKKQANMERSFAKKKEEMQVTLTNMLESTKATADKELTQLRNQLSQTEQAASMSQAQLSMETQRLQNELIQAQAQLRDLDQSKNMAHHQLTQERESHYQAIARVEKAREEAENKLASTLQTLQNTCASTQSLDAMLRDKETQLHEVQSRLQYIERERKTENEISKQHWMEATDRANELQHNLDYEVKHKSSLISVQNEMEKHLGLERERADLLQQKLDAECLTKQTLVTSLQEVDHQLRQELERVSHDNIQLTKELDRISPQLDRTSQDNTHLMKELDRVRQQMGEELERAFKENKHLKEELDRVGQRLGEELEQAFKENNHLKEELDRVGQRLGGELDRASQDNMHLNSELGRVRKELGDELDRASKENIHLRDELDKLGQQLGGEIDRFSKENKVLKSELERWGEDNMYLKKENDRFSQLLQKANEVGATLKTNLDGLQAKYDEQVQVAHASISECVKLKGECEGIRIKTNTLSEMKSLLEAKVGKLEAKVQDQVIDLEAARMSEAEVEKSLEESLQNGSELEKLTQHLESKLRNAMNECEKVAEQLVQVSHEKGEIVVALDERMREVEEMKQKIAKDERANGQDRKEIAGALAGFDAEMNIAEQKLSSVLQSNADLESKLVSLTAQLESEKETANFQLKNAQMVIETLQEEVGELIEAFKKKEVALKKNTSDEMNNMESQFIKVNEECNAQLLKYEADIGVYEEAIQMLRNQVDALQELADSESANCIQLAKDMETQFERSKVVLREELQEELQITLKEELKATFIEELRLEDLVQMIEQKTSLERSVTQPTQCIQESLQSNESVDTRETTYAGETVAKHPRPSGDLSSPHEVDCKFSTKDGHDSAAPSTPDVSRDLGHDLDELLSSIEAQLEVEK